MTAAAGYGALLAVSAFPVLLVGLFGKLPGVFYGGIACAMAAAALLLPHMISDADWLGTAVNCLVLAAGAVYFLWIRRLRVRAGAR